MKKLLLSIVLLFSGMNLMGTLPIPIPHLNLDLDQSDYFGPSEQSREIDRLINLAEKSESLGLSQDEKNEFQQLKAKYPYVLTPDGKVRYML